MLEKEDENYYHFLKPKFLARYAPGDMRKEKNGSRLDPNIAFSLNRLSNINNYESGLTIYSAHHCWDTPSPCGNVSEKITVYNKNGYFFIQQLK